MNLHSVTSELRYWGKKLTDTRVAAKMTQAQLHKTTGLNQAFLSTIETGRLLDANHVSSSTVAKLQIVAQALNHPLPEPFASAAVAVAPAREVKPRAVESVRTTTRSTPRTGDRKSKALLAAVLDLVGAGKLNANDAVNLLALAQG